MADTRNIVGDIFTSLAGGLAGAAGPDIYTPFISNLQKTMAEQRQKSKVARGNRQVIDGKMTDPAFAAAAQKVMGTDTPEDTAAAMSDGERQTMLLNVGTVEDTLAKSDKDDDRRAAMTGLAGDYIQAGAEVPPSLFGEATMSSDELALARLDLVTHQRSQFNQDTTQASLSKRLHNLEETISAGPLEHTGTFQASASALMEEATDLDEHKQLNFASDIGAAAARVKRGAEDKQHKSNASLFERGDFSPITAEDPFAPADPSIYVERFSPRFNTASIMAEIGQLGADSDELVIKSAVEKYPGGLPEAQASMAPADFQALMESLHRTSDEELQFRGAERASAQVRSETINLFESAGVVIDETMFDTTMVDGKPMHTLNPTKATDAVMGATGDDLTTVVGMSNFERNSPLPPEVKKLVLHEARERKKKQMGKDADANGQIDESTAFPTDVGAFKVTSLVTPKGEEGPSGRRLNFTEFGDDVFENKRSLLSLAGFQSEFQGAGLGQLGIHAEPKTQRERRALVEAARGLSFADRDRLHQTARVIVYDIQGWTDEEAAEYIKDPRPGLEAHHNAGMTMLSPTMEEGMTDLMLQQEVAIRHRLDFEGGYGTDIANARNMEHADLLKTRRETIRALEEEGGIDSGAYTTQFATFFLDSLDLEGDALGERIQTFLGAEENLFGEGGQSVTEIVGTLDRIEDPHERLRAFTDWLETHTSTLVANDAGATAKKALKAELRLASVRRLPILAGEYVGNNADFDADNPEAVGFGNFPGNVFPSALWGKHKDPHTRSLLMALAVASGVPRK